MKAVFSSFFTLACPWVDVELTVLGVAPILFYYWNFLGRDFVFFGRSGFRVGTSFPF